jgi:FkbM family methyltransferase
LQNLISSPSGYEDAFHHAMAASIRPGDTVWDIGANVGVYTLKFLEWTSPSGQVVAFEPFEQASRLLCHNVAAAPAASRCIIRRVAVSDFCGQASMRDAAGSSGVSTTMHLADSHEREPAIDGGTSEVRVCTVDALVSEFQLPAPTVTKIDVEGYEGEVCSGGQSTFTRPESKSIFIEVHFKRLEQRGRAETPSRIVHQLRQWGYKLNWVDPSHLHAMRR